MSENIPRIRWGPCCFCAQQIADTAIDPCRVTVETSGGTVQWWYCHAACFKGRLANPPELIGMFEPAHV